MLDSAIADASRELSRTDRASGTISIAGSAISRYFKTDQTSKMRTLLDRLKTIQNRLGRGLANWQCVDEVGCRARCKSNVDACAAPRTIFICPKHFTVDDMTGALTLIHETAHQAGLGLGLTEVYSNLSTFSSLTTAQA